MESSERKRGRPTTLPPGQKHGLNCVLVNGEMEALRNALEALGVSQRDFARACVLFGVAEVNAGRIPSFLADLKSAAAPSPSPSPAPKRKGEPKKK
jgi:hypothetical protein